MRRLDSESGLQHLLLWGLRPGDGAFHLLSRLRGFEDPFALGDPELKNRMTSTGGLRKIAVKEKLQNYQGMPWTIQLGIGLSLLHDSQINTSGLLRSQRLENQFNRTMSWYELSGPNQWFQRGMKMRDRKKYRKMTKTKNSFTEERLPFSSNTKRQNRWNGLPCSFSSPHRPHWHGLEWKLPELLSNALRSKCFKMNYGFLKKMTEKSSDSWSFYFNGLSPHPQLHTIDLWKRLSVPTCSHQGYQLQCLPPMTQWPQWLLAQHPASHQASCTESNSNRSQCRHRAHSDCFLSAEQCE